jgi:dTDP-4-dehydrorhamnose 3,5-epimerase
MKLHATPLTGLTVIETNAIADERGRFSRVFCEDALRALRPGLHFPQINVSETFHRGTVRGMHFQRPPAAECKLIRCLRGRVFDVAVDLRPRSPTYLHWHSVELADDSHTEVFIPEGFAHGFQALTDDVQLLYLHTARWSREHEDRLRPDDPTLSIAWPLAVARLSDADGTARLLDDGFVGVSP